MGFKLESGDLSSHFSFRLPDNCLFEVIKSYGKLESDESRGYF